tara:strand:+ start:347 stop:523 length:177 start_codon:yes stop_codon:yes gene_type:complete
MAEEVKEGMTFEQVKTMIVGSEDKVALLNLFTGLINENARLKSQVDELNKPKATESSS